MARGVCSGMEYLSTVGYVHRVSFKYYSITGCKSLELKEVYEPVYVLGPAFDVVGVFVGSGSTKCSPGQRRNLQGGRFRPVTRSRG